MLFYYTKPFLNYINLYLQKFTLILPANIYTDIQNCFLN